MIYKAFATTPGWDTNRSRGFEIEECAAPGLANLRDIGGARTASGRIIRSGRLYRSDAPMIGDGTPQVNGWPPRLVIDLRAADERASPHPLAGPETRILEVPFLREAAPVAMLADEDAGGHGLIPIYRDILASTDAIVEVVRQIATQPGPVLVHCAAGKDRTGVAIAVVQSALGLEREAILADYRLTQANMPGVLRRLLGHAPDPGQRARLQTLADVRSPLLDAPADALAIVLDELQAARGTSQWLLARGTRPSELDQLRARLLY